MPVAHPMRLPRSAGPALLIPIAPIAAAVRWRLPSDAFQGRSVARQRAARRPAHATNATHLPCRASARANAHLQTLIPSSRHLRPHATCVLTPLGSSRRPLVCCAEPGRSEAQNFPGRAPLGPCPTGPRAQTTQHHAALRATPHHENARARRVGRTAGPPEKPAQARANTILQRRGTETLSPPRAPKTQPPQPLPGEERRPLVGTETARCPPTCSPCVPNAG
jgi:hypothetical protein